MTTIHCCSAVALVLLLLFTWSLERLCSASEMSSHLSFSLQEMFIVRKPKMSNISFCEIADRGYKSWAQIWEINGFGLNTSSSEAWVLNCSYFIQVQRWCSKQLYMFPGNVIAKEKLLRTSGTRLEFILEDQEMEMMFPLRFSCLVFRGFSSKAMLPLS